MVATPLGSFLRSGGSAFCLTLRLDRRSVPHGRVAMPIVARIGVRSTRTNLTLTNAAALI